MTAFHPDAIGRYRIDSFLGRGGMGVVYRATDKESGRRVAIKTVVGADADLIVGIRREIHALARIRHPGIVRIVDEGLSEGIPWYAMEIVQGTDMRRFLEDKELHPAFRKTAILGDQGEAAPWWTMSLSDISRPTSLPRAAASGTAPLSRPLGEILTLFRRLCAPLAYLHGEGIVHRDLKPANVLVKPGGFPVILDFGLMSQFRSDTFREVLRLQSEASGTIAYIAPEQGEGRQVDARADLYALGCMLYEMVTGIHPFAAKTPMEMLNRRYKGGAGPSQ